MKKPSQQTFVRAVKVFYINLKLKFLLFVYFEISPPRCYKHP